MWWNYPNRNTDAPIRWRMMERGDYNINSVIRIKFPFISYQRLIVTLLLCGGLLDFFWSFCCLVLVNNCIFFIPEWSLFDVIMMSYKGWFNFIYFLIKKITSWYSLVPKFACCCRLCSCHLIIYTWFAFQIISYLLKKEKGKKTT